MAILVSGYSRDLTISIWRSIDEDVGRVIKLHRMCKTYMIYEAMICDIPHIFMTMFVKISYLLLQLSCGI